MSSGLFKGSAIMAAAKKRSVVKLTPSQTAKQAASSIRAKYKTISGSAMYYHRGGGDWVRYSPAKDMRSTAKKTTTSKPKNYSKVAHQIDVRGIDTKKAGKKALTARKRQKTINSNRYNISITDHKKGSKMEYEYQMSNGSWTDAGDKISSMIEKAIKKEEWFAPRQNRQPVTTQSEMKKAMSAGRIFSYGPDWYEKIRAKPLTKTAMPVDMIKCACGHTVPKKLVMSTSSGTSCHACYDRMSR